MSSREFFERLDALLDEALDLLPNERVAFVASRCADDPAMREAVLRRLRAIDESGDFLQGSATEIAAPFFDGEADGLSGAHLAAARVGPFRIVREIGPLLASAPSA